MKIIWHRISIQTLLFQACLPTRQNGVENRDKAYSVDFVDSVLWTIEVRLTHSERYCLLCHETKRLNRKESESVMDF